MRPLTLANMVLLACCAIGQAQDGTLTFEVSSVKPHVQTPGKESNGSSQRGGPGTEDPGQIAVDNRTLRTLIIEAYGIHGYQLVHPAWVGTERFDIVAKVARGATKQQARIMMQNLLVERFQLKFHHEQKDLPVYELGVGKGGSKMKPSEAPAADRPIELGKLLKGGDGFPEIPAGTNGMIETFMQGRAKLTARKQTVKQLIQMLADRVDRPVLDVTGLTGEYDFTLLWSPETMPEPAAPLAEADAPQLFDALERQLGLKLTAKKVPTDMMVVDSANKMPIEN